MNDVPSDKHGKLTAVFVYGTLKRGGANHHFLAGQRFIGEARTAPGFQMYELEGYPGMIAQPDSSQSVTGEIWEVDSACLAALDELEGLAEGLYRREAVPLAPPHSLRQVEAYLYAKTVAGRRVLGPTWP